MLISPLLKKIYILLNKKILIIGGGILLCIIPTITFNGDLLNMNSDFIRLFFKFILWGPVWFSYLFLLISYIKNDSRKILSYNKKKYIYIFIFCYLTMFIIEVLLYFYGQKGGVYSNFAMKNYATIRDMSSLPCIVGAICLFLYFYKTKIKLSNKINNIAKYMFGIYLLQCHPNTINFIWREIISLNNSSGSFIFLANCFLLVMIIFFTGIIIETFRIYIIRWISQKIKI